MSLQLFRRKLSPLWSSSRTCYQNRCFFLRCVFLLHVMITQGLSWRNTTFSFILSESQYFFTGGSSKCRLKTWMSLSWNIYIHSNIASCRLRRCVIRFVFSSNCHEIFSRFKSFIICVNVAISCFGIQGTKFENMPQKLYTFKIF